MFILDWLRTGVSWILVQFHQLLSTFMDPASGWTWALSIVGLVIVILLVKLVAYSTAFGGGFRGGPIFPATFLGVGVAVAGSLIFPEVSVSALAAAGIAAGSAAMIKLPATSALLGLLLISGAGAAIAPFAILGAVVGLIVRLIAERRLESPADSAPTPTH